MINWIKNYIDKKVEEKFQQEKEAIRKEKNNAVSKVRLSVDREIAESIGNIIKKWEDYEEISYSGRSGVKTESFKELEYAVMNVVRQCFRRELDNLHNRYQNLQNMRLELIDKMNKYAQDEEFIQKIIDNINQKQLKQ